MSHHHDLCDRCCRSVCICTVASKPAAPVIPFANQVCMLRAGQLASEWYTGEQVLGWLTRDGVTVKDRRELAELLTTHLRLAFAKGYFLGSGEGKR